MNAVAGNIRPATFHVFAYKPIILENSPNTLVPSAIRVRLGCGFIPIDIAGEIAFVVRVLIATRRKIAHCLQLFESKVATRCFEGGRQKEYSYYEYP
eukprot:m.63824 g.63824  ORF g.63824 m.63824 type:complete len:97 (+) comp23344_c0_seq1:629-919(+)